MGQGEVATGPHKPALVLLAEQGFRIGEAKYLTWDDVDFDRGVLHVRAKDDWKPKTGDQRAVPLTPVVRRLLMGLSRHSRWVLTSAPSRNYPKGDHQVSERRLLLYLKRVLKWLGLKGHLHTFRHSFISHAVTQGIPEAIIRQWVGHVDADILKLYTHINDTASRAVMDRLAAASEQPPKAEPGGLEHNEEASWSVFSVSTISAHHTEALKCKNRKRWF